MRALSRQRPSRLATRMALLPRGSIKIFSAMIWWSNRQNCQVKRGRTPNQAQERGVCQDAQTGKPFILPDPPRGSGKVYPGGDEGDPSLPRGDDRDLRGSNRRGDATPPFFLRTTVFPPDNRVLQTPTTSFPFRAVVALRIKYPLTPSSEAKGCTGSLIGGKHVLTAGHCVFSIGDGGWATSIKALPGLDQFTQHRSCFHGQETLGDVLVPVWRLGM